MKYLKKTLSFVLAFAMAFTMVIVPKGSVSAAGTTDDSSTGTSGYTYFDTTMFNYDTDKFNAATKKLESGTQGIYFNDGGDKTTISGTPIANENYNKWTGKWDADGVNGPVQDTDKLYACTGIVKSQLDKNGNIVFNYLEAGIFDTSKTTGKSTYTNVQMPFKTNSEGYYYYDSEEYDVKFPNNTPASNVKLEDEGQSAVKNGDYYKNSFLPFSENTTKTTYNGKTINVDGSAKFHFGMNMSVKFYMTEDGKITTANNEKKDMTFEFSGDDDVWVFVDGKLVLDIGGIHDAIKADINFATGSAKVYKGTTSTVARETKLFNTESSPSGIFDTDADTWRSDTDRPHTLQVFYLERGAGLSNCKIKFNLPQQDTLDVTKSLGNDINNTTDLTDKDLKALLNQSFRFKISSSSDNKTYSAYANKKYTIYENGSNVGSGVTNSNGEFTLKFNQTASFVGEKTNGDVTDLGKDGYFKVKEITDSNSKYTTKWNTSKTVKGKTTDDNKDNSTEAVLKVDKKTVSDESSKYHFTFINTLQPTLNDDVVVLDYGKKVKIDVLANDVLFASERKIAEINTENCKNGELTLSDNNTTLTYRPYKYMDSVDKATYTVSTADNDELGISPTANVSIMPATTVYYEDNFGGSGKEGEDGLAITYTGNWTTVKDDGTTDSIKSNTNTDYQDDGIVGNGNQYGYDKSYEGDGKFSNGSSAVVEGTYDEENKTYDATAKFTFTGTGFDIISRTDTTCGNIHVVVTDTNDNLVLKDENGDFYVSDFKAEKYPKKKTISVINKSENTLYQIPVISCKGLEHGTYNVKIEVAGGIEEIGLGSTFYLDAIRIYDPIKVDNGQDSNDDSTNSGQGAATIKKEVVDAYGKDNELDTKVTKIKDIIVQGDGKINGSAFIDTNFNGKSDITDNKDTYNNLGPNNEVYLAKGQSITFNINADDQIPARVYIGAKSAHSTTATLAVTSTGSSQKGNRDITSATDMYYDVTDYVKFRTVDGKNVATLVIGNKDKSISTDDVDLSNILALTNIKLAYTDKVSIASANSLFSVPEDNTEAIKVAKKLLAKPQKVEETEQPTEEKEANLEIASANFTSSKVSILKDGTLIVKTSADVKYLGILDSNGKVIQPNSITSKVDESLGGTANDSIAKTWTVKIKFSKIGNQKIAVYGIGKDGSVSKEVKTISVKVTLFGSIKDMFREW